MTRQEEIREGIAMRLYWGSTSSLSGVSWSCLSDIEDKAGNISSTKLYWLNEADKFLSYLHSQGVVIKSKGELPISIVYSKKAPITIEQTVITPNIKRMIKALNLVAVEPIEEE